MDELKLKSSLTAEEIDKNFADTDFFGGIMDGLTEALAYEQGAAKAATIARKRSLPNVNVAATRKSLGLSQKDFASAFGVSARTVEAWEAGRNTPGPTARILLYLIADDPEIVHRIPSFRAYCNRTRKSESPRP